MRVVILIMSVLIVGCAPKLGPEIIEPNHPGYSGYGDISISEFKKAFKMQGSACVVFSKTTRQAAFATSLHTDIIDVLDRQPATVYVENNLDAIDLALYVVNMYNRRLKFPNFEGYKISSDPIRPPYQSLCGNRALLYVTPQGIQPSSSYKTRDEGITAVLVSGSNLPSVHTREPSNLDDPCNSDAKGDTQRRVQKVACGQSPSQNNGPIDSPSTPVDPNPIHSPIPVIIPID